MKDQYLYTNLEEAIVDLKKMACQEFAPRASQYDAAYSFPKENFEALFRSGLNAATVSEEYGGLGIDNNKGNISMLWAMTKEIAKADMATARCWEGHNNALMLLDNLGTPDQKEKWFSGVVERGEIWTVWSGEPLLKVPGQKQNFGTTVTKTERGFLVNGSKVFCSSAPGATWANLLVNTEGSGAARNANGTAQFVIMLACDLSDPSVTFDDSWWKPIGMRGSVSYHVKFDNTLIPFANQIGESGQFLADEWQTRWIPQYAATFLGGAEAAYEYTLRHVESQSRKNDPYVQHRIGKMAINIATSQLWLDHVARLWDEGKIEEAKSAGNMVRYLVEQLAMQTVENAVHICGARALIQPSPLERILRDITLYTRHDDDDLVLATIGKSVLGQVHDRAFFKNK